MGRYIVVRFFLWLVTLGFGQTALAAMPFPMQPATSDVGDILDTYPAYLQYVVAIGKSHNSRVASQLERGFTKLRSEDEALAARFLKGLRFELVQKLQLAGLNPRKTNTSTNVMRDLVGRYLSVWAREVDEYRFRAYAHRIARRTDD